MDLGIDLSQELRPIISPSLIEANYILSLSQLELQEAIRQELLANPALELDERAICPTCGGILDATFCPTCRLSHQAERRETSYEDYPEVLTQQTAQGFSEDDFDPLTLVATELGLREQILSDASTLLRDDDLPIAAWLIDCLDDRGYLATSLAAVAAEFGVPEERVERILELIQQIAPVGVAARDMRESLLLQIDYLERIGASSPPAVRRIVADHLEDLATHKHGYIAAQLGITADDVEAAREFIRNQLSPSPLQRQEARPWRSPNSDPYVAPDVVIALVEDELLVEVIEAQHYLLRMNGLYASLATTLAGRNGANGEVNDGGKKHVRDLTTRAKLFIANINQRRETLQRIANCLVELQGDFLRGGVRELRPLTRAVVAQQIGVHESTVSRATANKYVMLPSRQVIPFSDFFTPSLSIKDVIRELILKERAKGRPLTDREICDRLLHQGIRIARRTVAKYRAELGILPSTMR
jgi:RNA polymerase sigma-54 factor